MYRVTAALVLCAVLAAQPSVSAWHAKGHMAVAYVAYQHLTPGVRTRVGALLRRNPAFSSWEQRLASIPVSQRGVYRFMLAAGWADDIKSDHNYTNAHDTPADPESHQNIGYGDKLRHRSWHFVNHMFSDDGTTLVAVPAVNAEERITLFQQALKSNASDNVKSYDLVWLEHLGWGRTSTTPRSGAGVDR